MASGSGEVPFWTFFGLIVAFMDLLIAYILLCVSACLFFPSKFLSFIGLYLPCPCTGFFGYQDSEFCWHKLLIDWPIRKISYVLELIKGRFPFGLICLRDQQFNLEVDEVGGGKRPLNFCSSGDRGSGYDAKGKRIVSQKQKSGIRRRRRAVLGDGKHPTGLHSNRGNAVGSSGDFCNEMVGSLDCRRVTEDGLPDIIDAENGILICESARQCLEWGGSYGKGEVIEQCSSSEKFTCNDSERLGSVQNEDDKFRMLEKELEEEKTAHAAIYLELEKERAAAASAADEAMAMILRLQEDKASMGMEARQYQRMIEEKFAYDEEEMDILKEILVRRERENHFLEKELEAYREMNVSDTKDLESGLSNKKHSIGLRPSPLKESKEKSVLILQQTEKSNNKETSCTLASQSDRVTKHELTSDFSLLLGLPHKTVDSLKKRSLRDVSLTSQGLREADAFDCDGKILENDREHYKQEDINKHRNQIDAVHDIHVVDDKSIIWKENDQESSQPFGGTGSDSGISSCEVLKDSPGTSISEIEPIGAVNNDLETNSAVAGERLKIDSEVEWLRERLRTVQEEKEKLTFSAEQQERVNALLKLVEEIVNQLQEFQQLIEPARQASLPPSSSK